MNPAHDDLLGSDDPLALDFEMGELGDLSGFVYLFDEEFMDVDIEDI